MNFAFVGTQLGNLHNHLTQFALLADLGLHMGFVVGELRKIFIAVIARIANFAVELQNEINFSELGLKFGNKNCTSCR